MTLSLPAQIHGLTLLAFLSEVSRAEDTRDVLLDFAGLRRVTPGGLVALVAVVTRWLREHRRVVFLNLDRCAITGYLQRMDVLRACGAELPESFQRHEALGRFVPVQLLERDVETMGREIAACLAPGGDDYDHTNAALYDLAWYVFTETANNARQHSGGLGYAAAQVNRSEGLVRIAIADNGKGIRQSFIDAGLQWAGEVSDGDAILKALEPKVSSRGRPTNEGVGLTLVAGLVRQAGGWLLIVSGSGVLTMKGGECPRLEVLPSGGVYPGTLVVAVFRQAAIRDFAVLLHEAKIQAGLLRPAGASGKFQA